MKKFYVLLLLLFLVACDGMSGKSYITCVEVTEGLVGSGIGQTIITIQGNDEDILVWTVNTAVTRAEFEQEFLQEAYLSDDEIHELFERYSQSVVEGVTSHIDELTNDHVVITMIYDYSMISHNDLNFIWDVDDFENVVTLSSAISGLENQGAVCEIEMIELKE